MMNSKSLLDNLSNKRNLILFYDYGSLNCALELFKNVKFKNNNILYSQKKFNKKEKTNIQKTLNVKFYYNKFIIYFIAVFGKSNIIIFQSSKVRIIEKIISKFSKKYFVIQDYINDFKFNKNAIYITPFSYDNKISKKFNIITIKGIRPTINLKNTHKKLNNSLLVIGAPNLLNGVNITFLKFIDH